MKTPKLIVSVMAVCLTASVACAQGTKLPEALKVPAIQAAYQRKLQLQRDVRDVDETTKELVATSVAR
jgi:hypothetical protein